MAADYPSGDENRDAVVELLCDEWPTEVDYREWDDRCALVVRLLDVLDKNRLTVIDLGERDAALADAAHWKANHDSQVHKKRATHDRLVAALTEVTRLREALTLPVADVAAVVRRYRDGWGRGDDDWYLISSSWAREVVREPMTTGERAVSDAVIAMWDGALAEGSDVPGVVPACAGRSDYAHERTQMTPAPSGWRCPVCGEVAAGSDVPPTGGAEPNE